MKILKIMIFMVILIMSVGAVCAAENSTNDILRTDSQEILETTHDEVYTTNEALFTNLTDEIEDEGTFTNLANEIDKSEDTIDLQHDYTFNNESDTGYVVIKKNNFIINGNNHILDGNQQSGIFNIIGDNITINDLVFINGMADMEGIIDSTGTLTLNNITFISNNGTIINNQQKDIDEAIKNKRGMINCYNSRFIDNYAQSGPAIFIENGTLTLKNINITTTVSNTDSQIWARYSAVILKM